MSRTTGNLCKDVRFNYAILIITGNTDLYHNSIPTWIYVYKR